MSIWHLAKDHENMRIALGAVLLGLHLTNAITVPEWPEFSTAALEELRYVWFLCGLQGIT